MARQFDKISFTLKAKRIHCEKYDYSAVEYVNNYTPIKIKCPTHGYFYQKPLVHLRGSGCRQCTISKAKLPINVFIQKSHQIHKHSYDYSEATYVNAKSKVKIICKVHGPFYQIADNHIRGMGCLKCSRLESAKKRKHTFNQFVLKAKHIHSTNYTYPLPKIPFDLHSPIEIICKLHGPFNQKPESHLSGHGCPFCGHEKGSSSRRYTTDEFIKKASAIHNNRYNYSKAVYKGIFTPVIIICPIHGEFQQSPSSHQKHGCPICTKEAKSETHGWTLDSFISKANRVHNNKYDYSLTCYINAKSKVTIICKTHGTFQQSPDSHLRGSGCPKCHRIRQSFSQSTSFQSFLSKAKEIHGNRYNYDKSSSTYKNLSEKVTITCKYHGDFHQIAEGHIKGRGCPSCSESWAEREIANWLDQCNLVFERQKVFQSLKGKNNRSLPFDFYIPSSKLLVEYDGEQHFVPIKGFGGTSKHQQTQNNDTIKSNWAKSNGYLLIRIPYTQQNEIGRILSNALNISPVEKHSNQNNFVLTNNLLIDERANRFAQIVSEKQGKIIVGSYAGEKAKIKLMCKTGHTWDAVPQHINKGVWCPICAGTTKLGIDAMMKLAIAKNGKCLSLNYINAHTKLQWQCQFGHEWMAAPMHIKRGRWCPFCKKETRKH